MCRFLLVQALIINFAFFVSDAAEAASKSQSTSAKSITYSLGGLTLTQNQSVTVGSGSASVVKLIMQSDANLVILVNSSPVWSSKTGGRTCPSGCTVYFQPDGNLASYRGTKDLWSSGTYNVNASKLVLQNSVPYLQILNTSGKSVWSSGGSATTSPSPSPTVSPTPKPTASPTVAPTASPTVSPVSGLPAAVSMSSLTANNTSASSAFTDIYMNYVTGAVSSSPVNGDALPINVSNVSVHSLMPKHPNMPIYVETQDWFCHNSSNTQNNKLVSNASCGGALDIGYDSATNAANQVDDMVRRGIDGASVNWYGPGTQGDQAMANMLKRSSSAYAGKFKVTLDLDKGAFDSPGSCASSSNTNVANCFLDYINSSYGSSSAIMKINGKIAVMWFILDEDVDSSINWATVKSHANSLNMMMIIDNGQYGGFDFYNGSGFADGSYSWFGGSNFLSAAAQEPSKIAIGGAWRGFNDVAASWTSNGQTASRCGQTWLDSFATNDNSSVAMAAVMISTWDDYAEGSEMETGIDNCLKSIAVSNSSGNLKWTDSFGSDSSGYVGTENTVDHYEIYVSTDNGSTASLVAQVAPTGNGSGSIAISSLNIPSGSYLAYVRAVGKASIQNHMSAGVSISR